MIKLLAQAAEKVQALPPEMQEQAARMPLVYAGDDQPVIEMTADEEASFKKSYARAERGAFATDEQVLAIWAKQGL